MTKNRAARRSGGPSQPEAASIIAAPPGEELPGSRWKSHAWRLVLLWLVVLAAYSNSFEAKLTFDNVPVIARDPRIREATSENVRRILTEEYWYKHNDTGLYRPLTTISYLFNYAVLGDGQDPRGYHWINFWLHGINVSLVYALGLLIFGDAALALALAAIWGLHPLLTESVTNIVGRADLLAAFGVLAGLLCHARAAVSTGRRKFAWLAGLTMAQVVGLFSKEGAAMLPGAMLLGDVLWRERSPWKQRWPGYALVALPIGIYLYLRSQVDTHLVINFPDNPLIAAGFWTARLSALKVVGDFLWLFLWPVRLSADYSYKALALFGERPWDDVRALIPIVGALGALLYLVGTRVRRDWKKLVFFAAFFAVTLAPTSNLVFLIGANMAERFIYLPSLGLAGCALIAIQALTERFSTRAVWGVAGALALILGARTYARNLDWRDGVSLWTSAINAYPEAARPHNNLGYELEQIPGRLPDAIAQYQEALRIRPDYAEAHYDLGNALLRTPGRLNDSIAEYQAALRISPRYAEAHNNLGSALLRIPGRLPDAAAEFQAALQINSNYAEAHNNLGSALLQIPGRLSQAVAEFRAATRIKPGYPEAHNNLGNALARIPGELPQAIAEYHVAIAAKPDYAEAHNNLGNALLQTPGRLADAIPEFQAALRANPDYAEAHTNLGSALYQSGHLNEAITQYQAATRLQPDLADAHYNLGGALLQAKRVQEAIAEFEAVLRIKPDPEVRQILQRLRPGAR